MPREDEDFLSDMHSYANDALDFTEGLSFTEFVRSGVHHRAACHAMIIIGEAASQLSDDVRQSNPHIEWGRITGMRNRLVHGYFDTDLDIVWRTIHDDLPALIAQLEPLVQDA